MEYRWLGKTGVRVSSLAFGTMSFGGDADDSTSEAMYKMCRERGINFFDCANTYAGGRSEDILGKCIKHERDQVVITTQNLLSNRTRRQRARPITLPFGAQRRS